MLATYVERSGSGWLASYFRTPWYPSLDVPSVWALQYEQRGAASVSLTRLPHSDPAEKGVETIVLSDATLAATYSSELTLGGWRRSTGDRSGTESGNCTVHEVVITSQPLSTTEMQTVYTLLQQRWAPMPAAPGPYAPSYGPSIVSANVWLHYDAADVANVLTPEMRPVDGPVAVRRWRPCEGHGGDAETPWTLHAVPATVDYRPAAGGSRPGVHIAAGSLLATGAPLSLVNRAVFVVVTVHAASGASFRTLLANRRGSDRPGTVILRLDCTPANPFGPCTTYAATQDKGWFTAQFGGTVSCAGRCPPKRPATPRHPTSPPCGRSSTYSRARTLS